MVGPCLFCNQRDLRPVRPYRTETVRGKEIFGESWLCECLTCGLVQMTPRPSRQLLARYYALDYRAGCCAGADVADVSRFPKDNLYYYNRGQSIVELIAPLVETNEPDVLDIGAGYGHFLDAFAERFPNARRMAIELSEMCVEHLQSLGIEVVTESVDEVLPRMNQQFDVVVLSHVLEHLLDPKTVLEIIHRYLAPDGVLYIEVPNIPPDSLLRHADHVWVPRYDEPHITFFSVSTLQNVLTSIGFHVELCDTAGPEYKHISGWRYRLPTMRWFVQGLLPPPVFHFLRRQAFTRPFRIQERVESFYQYGGFRIWIRAASRGGMHAE